MMNYCFLTILYILANGLESPKKGVDKHVLSNDFIFQAICETSGGLFLIFIRQSILNETRTNSPSEVSRAEAEIFYERRGE